MTERESEWRRATRRLSDLICPKCAAFNRPGATIIDRDEKGVACCGVCSFSWDTKAL